MKSALTFGFFAGLAFMASQDLWWFISGLVGICRG